MTHGRFRAGGFPYRRLILPVYVPSLLLAISQGALIPVLPLYARSFGISYGLVGLVLAGQALGTLAADVPAGVLLRRLGMRTAMVLGMAVTVFSIVALYWARSVPETVIYRIVGGIGGALFNVARHAYLADIVRADSRGRAISFQGGVFRMGSLLGPAAGGTLAAAVGVRPLFLAVGATCTVATVLLAVFGRGHTDSATRAPGTSEWRGSALLRALSVRRRVLTFAGLGHLFAQMIRAGRTVAVPLFAADVLGLDVQGIGLVESVSRAVDVTLFVPAGMVMDRWGRKWAIVPSFLLQTVGMALVPLSGSVTQLVLATCVYSIGNGLGSGSMMILGADLAPEGVRGEFLGVWRLIGDSGASGGPLVVGAVADLLVLPGAIWVVSAAGLAASVVFALLVPETLRPPPVSRIQASEVH